MGRRITYRENLVIGGWKLGSRLGSGGNGEVWSATKDNREGAIKLLKNIRQTTYSRFKAEIRAIDSNQDIDGVIPLLEHFLPDEITSSSPWFVMPVATRFSDWRSGKEVKNVVRGMIELGKTLSELHNREVCHRDIKPANILLLNERLCLSDFGLVKYPGREELTERKQDIGPKFTMAPEMRRLAAEANGFSADVYSFAKSLWIGIVEDYTCFDGQYNPYSIVSINNYCKGLYTKSLNDLLVECTDNDPLKRPSMAEVVERLEAWLKINDNFHDRNLTEWFDLQNKFFPAGAPSSVTWFELDDIVTVMKEIAQVKSLNHLFFPDGGGHTFIDVGRASENGFLAIKVSGKLIYSLKPRKLTFESFGVDPMWNYFRIEAEEVEQTGVYGDSNHKTFSEELVEISPCEYIHRSHWDMNEYNGRRLPDGSRLVVRYFKGSFVIFSTRSPYNLTPSTYDARHNKMSESEFRKHIKMAAERFGSRALVAETN